jgi:hypothetical protein
MQDVSILPVQLLQLKNWQLQELAQIRVVFLLRNFKANVMQ